MKSTRLSGGLVFAASLAFATLSPAAVILEERFDYADEAALDAAWILVDGQGNFLQLMTSDEQADHAPFMRLNNGMVYRDLPTVINGADWTLSAKILQGAKQRATWIGLLDATGTKGYALFWDSGNADTGNGNGTVGIIKIDEVDPLNIWSFNGASLGSRVDSGHEIITYPFAEIELAWEAETGMLTASVDGVVKVTRTDTDFSSFAHLYIKGNHYQYYDDIVVTAVPEPASALLAVPAGLLMLRRRRERL